MKRKLKFADGRVCVNWGWIPKSKQVEIRSTKTSVSISWLYHAANTHTCLYAVTAPDTQAFPLLSLGLPVQLLYFYPDFI